MNNNEGSNKRTEVLFGFAGVILGAMIAVLPQWVQNRQARKMDASDARLQILARIHAAETVLNEVRTDLHNGITTNVVDWIRIGETLMTCGVSSATARVTVGDWDKLLVSMKNGSLVTDDDFKKLGDAFGDLAGVQEARNKFDPTNILSRVETAVTRIKSIVEERVTH
jgi:hypothetical protein